MRRRLLGAVAALIATALVASCGVAERTSMQPGVAIDKAALVWEPCTVYTGAGLYAVMRDALQTAGWPRLVEVPPATHRLSTHVKRCLYRYGTADKERDGDQSLLVFIYYELNNGGPLMAACKQRETPDAERPRLGDESCLEDTGQWRFRVGEQYSSVLIEVLPRITGRGGQLGDADTATFVAPNTPTALADLGLPVAMDIANRLR